MTRADRSWFCLYYANEERAEAVQTSATRWFVLGVPRKVAKLFENVAKNRNAIPVLDGKFMRL